MTLLTGPQPAALTDPPIPPSDRVASVTIQGGAIYGLSLLGQLRAVVDQGYEVVALSGTSAGAIVATLHWAGVSPDDVLQFFVGLAGPPNTVTDLLGDSPPDAPPGDQALRWRRWCLRRLAAAGVLPRWRIGDVVAYCGVRLPPGLLGLCGLGLAARHAGGVFSGDRFEQEVDRLVRRSPRVAPHLGQIPDAAGRLLTFGDLWGLMRAGAAYFPMLTVTATDLNTGELVLIRSTDPRFFDLPVATAVRASGGFPVFFRPVSVTLPDVQGRPRPHRLADGGIVCNFPAFVFGRRAVSDQFEADRWHPRDATDQALATLYRALAFQPWVNIGLRLAEEPPPAPERAGLRWGLGRLWSLLSGGTRTQLEGLLAKTVVERLAVVPQPFAETGWPHGLLEFDKLTPALARTMYRLGHSFATQELGQSAVTFDRPGRAVIQDRMADAVRSARLVLGDASERVTLRAALFVPDGWELRLTYRVNMDDPTLNPDRELVFEWSQGLAGFCYIRRRPMVCDLQRLGAAGQDRQFGLSVEQQRLVRGDRTWLMCVPVFDPKTASAYEYADNPAALYRGEFYTELPSPLDGALFGVLCLDADWDYSADPAAGRQPDPVRHLARADDPRVLTLRDILVAAAWSIGRQFDARFFAADPSPHTEPWPPES